MLAKLLKFLGVYKLYERWLLSQVRKGKMPEHIGVILDGNRRWAIIKGESPISGHRRGAEVGEKFLEWCLDLGVKTVTLYVLSIENLRRRPKEEVDNIIKLIEEYARRLGEDRRIHEKKVRIKALGRLELLPETLREEILQIQEKTKGYNQRYVNLAIAYGGRTEIMDAVKKLLLDFKEGRLSINDVDEDTFTKYLYTSHLPNPYPDLIIRSSGEERLSGFLLWQSAYSEFVFLDVYWPAFRKIDLLRAIRTYQQRHRRFGA